MRAPRSASWITALKVLPWAFAKASASRASWAGREMVFLTAAAMMQSAPGMKKSYHCGPKRNPAGLQYDTLLGGRDMGPRNIVTAAAIALAAACQTQSTD